ncbi:MAG TPA: hypothetical protein VH988_25575 [Thermoanaerobaculia bacterium]|nr:hypothetical protein [Thermoanaerobaculia bacterium]
MNRKSALVVLLAFMLGAMLGASRAMAHLSPSSDLLLPSFEVDLAGRGMTTYLSVTNSSDQPVQAVATVYTNWGIPVLQVPVAFDPHQVWTFNMVDWIGLGSLPGGPLPKADLAQLQAALTGETTPKDHRCYSTPTASGHAMGYVIVRVQGAGARPAALWGDFFTMGPGQGAASGDTLVDVSQSANCSDLCSRHALRFLAGAAVGNEIYDTQVVIWTARNGQPGPPGPSGCGYPDTASFVTAHARPFDEAGHPMTEGGMSFLPMEVVSLAELMKDLPANTSGWVDLNVGTTSFVGVRYDGKTSDSVAFQSVCLPDAPQTSVLSIRKTVNGSHTDSAPGLTLALGSPVTWTYKVTNSGRTALSKVHVTDDQGVAVTCPKSTLAAGESMSCTGKGTAVACQYKNVGTVFATPSSGPVLSAQDASYYYGDPAAALTLVLSTNGQHSTGPPGIQVAAGSRVNWTYLVTNSGKSQLTGVTVTDDQGAAVTCPQASLAPGASMTCTASGTAAPGQYSNLGTATGQAPCGPAVQAQDRGYYNSAYQPPPPPSISIVKSTNNQHVAAPPGPQLPVGSPVTWSYYVTNTGHAPLSNVHVSDDRGVAVTCPKSTLAAGESMTCTGSGTATACQYSNTGTAFGTPATGSPVTAQSTSWYFGATSPAIQIKKNTNGQHVTAAPGPTINAGSAVTWTYVVTNSGDVALSNVAVTDDQHVAVSCPKSTLQPGESMTCTGSGTAVSGQYHNVGTATGQTLCGSVVSASDGSWYYGQAQQPGITIQKSTNGQCVTAAPGPTIHIGSAVTWTYKVTNTGQTALSNVHVSDDKGVAVTCPKSTLAAGESMTCTGSGTATACQYSNTGTAFGTPATGSPVTAQSTSWYFGATSPAIQIKKNTNGQHVTAAPGPTINAGDPVAWTYVVTNSGDVALSNVAVSDDQHVAVACPKSTLQPGESMTCTGSGTAVSGQYHNVGTATGQPPCGSAVSASDGSWYYGHAAPPPPPPSIGIKKYTNGQHVTCAPGPTINVGDPVAWTYTVTNTGQVSLSSVSVTDNRGVLVTCPKSTLAAGESMTCTGSGTAVAGQYSNTGTASGTSSSGTTVSAHDDSWYYGQTPPQNQGCSPGYWKNHYDSWHSTGYSTTQKVSSVFSDVTLHFPDLGTSTLLGALSFSGGSGPDGAAQTLLHHAVAALLNSGHQQINYPLTTAGVISSVNSALKSYDRNTMLALASQLDADNNLSCPLN